MEDNKSPKTEETKKEEKKPAKKEIIKSKVKGSVKEFNTELRKQLNVALVSAFGFLIALSWKDMITEAVTQLSQKSPLQGQIINALITTSICVVGILVVTRLTRVKEEPKKS
jgi:ABC-type uncharacterized transport system YnjBCD permease subunit